MWSGNFPPVPGLPSEQCVATRDEAQAVVHLGCMVTCEKLLLVCISSLGRIFPTEQRNEHLTMITSAIVLPKVV